MASLRGGGIGEAFRLADRNFEAEVSARAIVVFCCVSVSSYQNFPTTFDLSDIPPRNPTSWKRLLRQGRTKTQEELIQLLARTRTVLPIGQACWRDCSPRVDFVSGSPSVETLFSAISRATQFGAWGGWRTN